MIGWFVRKLANHAITIGSGKFFRKGRYNFVYDDGGGNVVFATHPELLSQCFETACSLEGLEPEDVFWEDLSR